MSTTLVPYRPDFRCLPKAHAHFHTEDFRQKRSRILGELRCLSGLLEIGQSLNPEVLYKIVIPEGRLLQQGKDGLFRGVFYGDRGIDQHARFAEVRPGLMEAAKAVGSQVLLISIAMQLNRIEQMVESLSIEMHRDRIAEILSGVDQFDKAMLFSGTSNRAQAILHAIQTLHTGLRKTIAELGSRIAEAPDPENSLLYHLVPWNNKTSQAAKVMVLATESFQATLLGIRTLTECYSVLGEVEAARSMLSDYFEMVVNCNINAAAQKARLVKYSTSRPPQEPWETFLNALPGVQQQLYELLRTFSNSATTESVVEIEFMPFELQGAMNGDLP